MVENSVQDRILVFFMIAGRATKLSEEGTDTAADRSICNCLKAVYKNKEFIFLKELTFRAMETHADHHMYFKYF